MSVKEEGMRADERFIARLSGKETDRMPIIENSIWWGKTIERWHGEGLTAAPNYNYYMREAMEIQDYFGLDLLANWWIKPFTERTPFAQVVGAGMGAVTMEKYEKQLLPTLYPELHMDPDFIRLIRKHKQKGDLILELIVDGPFWEPREYMGIEPHLFAFYDEPELYHRMVYDLKEWQKRVVDYALNTLPFDYVTVAEDMSYNNGPMLSREHFNTFLAPYYREMVPFFKQYGLKVLVDSDGDISEAIEWFNGVGVEGYHPLEKQAGVDVNSLTARYPDTAFIGNFDKMVMHRGEKALREEFERLLPCIRKGRYVVSVDHQTPPSVGLEDYKTYVKLLKEYAGRQN